MCMHTYTPTCVPTYMHMHLYLYLYICVSCTYMCIQNVQLHVHTLWLHSGSSSSSHKLDMNNNGESANYDMQTPSASQPLIKLPHRARSWRGLLCVYSSRDLGRTLHSITTLSFALAVAQYTGLGPARDISSAWFRFPDTLSSVTFPNSSCNC